MGILLNDLTNEVLINLAGYTIQQDCGVELAVVAGAQSLHGLMDCVLVFISEQVRDFSSPVHGLDRDFDRFGFVSRDDVVHGSHVASWLDLDGVA